jgi:hypothetical protein
LDANSHRVQGRALVIGQPEHGFSYWPMSGILALSGVAVVALRQAAHWSWDAAVLWVVGVEMMSGGAALLVKRAPARRREWTKDAKESSAPVLKEKKRLQLEAKTLTTRNEFMKTVFGGGALLGLGIWASIEAWRRTFVDPRVRTPRALLDSWALIGLLREKGDPQADEIEAAVLDATPRVRDAAQREWAIKVNAGFLKVKEARKYELANPGTREGRSMQAIEDLNDITVPRGLLVIIAGQLATGYQVAAIDEEQVLEVTHQTAGGPRRYELLHFIGTRLHSIASAQAAESSLYFGRRSRPGIFTERGSSERYDSVVAETVKRKSHPSLIRALTRDGWVENGDLKAGFAAAWSSAQLLHEVGHFLNAADPDISGELSEVFQRFWDITNPLKYTLLMNTLFMADNQARQLRAAGVRQFDLRKPATANDILINFAVMFAHRLPDKSVAQTISDLMPERFSALADYATTLPESDILYAANWAMNDLPPVPARGTTWTFRVLSSKRHDSAAKTANAGAVPPSARHIRLAA